jgi:hypothetical protein
MDERYSGLTILVWILDILVFIGSIYLFFIVFYRFEHLESYMVLGYLIVSLLGIFRFGKRLFTFKGNKVK